MGMPRKHCKIKVNRKDGVNKLIIGSSQLINIRKRIIIKNLKSHHHSYSKNDVA